MIKLAPMPKTHIMYDAEDGSILITQDQEQNGEVTVYFPVQMVDTVIEAIKTAAAEHQATTE